MGKKQMIKASSNMNTPDAGLGHGGSISTLLSLEQSKRTPAPGQGSGEMELRVTPPTRRFASSLQPCAGNPPAAWLPAAAATAPSEQGLLWIDRI